MVRRLSAVWFADIVGYTALSNIDEEAAIGLVGMLQALSRHIVEKEYGGRVVKYIGDAVLAEFASTDSAVRSAIAVQERYIAAAEATGRPSMLRIGVHLGEVIKTPDGDIYGDGVNTASRLQGQASPGKVLISEDVWRQLRMRTEFHFQSLGEVELKGITARVAVFDVLFGGEAAVASSKSTANANAPKSAYAPGQGSVQVHAPVGGDSEENQLAPPAQPRPAARYTAAARPVAAVPRPARAKMLIGASVVALLVGGGSAATYLMMNVRRPADVGATEPDGSGVEDVAGDTSDLAAPSAESRMGAPGTEPVSAPPPERAAASPAQEHPPTQTGSGGNVTGETRAAAARPGDVEVRAGAPSSSQRGAASAAASGSAPPPPQPTGAPLIEPPASSAPGGTSPLSGVADPMLERELAIEQAVAALGEFARAVQEQSRSELSGPYRLRAADMAPLEQVFGSASGAIRAEVLNPRVRRIDAAGAEIDFLLILGFLDRQGAQQSFPLPFRAFVARQTTGWRITTVQALIG